jgi:hypothetical protein
MTSNFKLSNPSTQEYFNTSAFTAQTSGTYGNEPINPMHGPHFRHADMSLFKTFKLRDSCNLEFRAEAFNISNTASFANPGASLGGSFFGQITATSFNYQPRVFQFALKLSF